MGMRKKLLQIEERRPHLRTWVSMKRLKIQWVDLEPWSRPFLLIWWRRQWWLKLRFGYEDHPLFSERNQGSRGVPRHWHYAFGKRLSWWWHEPR